MKTKNNSLLAISIAIKVLDRLTKNSTNINFNDIRAINKSMRHLVIILAIRHQRLMLMIIRFLVVLHHNAVSTNNSGELFKDGTRFKS